MRIISSPSSVPDFISFPGLACIILAVVIYAIDLFDPTATASFFNIDILASFEDEIIVKSGPGEEDGEEVGVSGEDQEMKAVEGNANGDPKPEDADGHYRNYEVGIAMKHARCVRDPSLLMNT